jgi:hypothetical protein
MPAQQNIPGWVEISDSFNAVSITIRFSFRIRN